MENEKMMYGVGGLVLGGILVFLFLGGNPSKNDYRERGMMEKKTEIAAPKEDTTDDKGMSMGAMNEALKGKTGDEFDKAFIELMIEHHQGAIDMAALIDTRAKHQEIKTLGKNIISAQTKEIKEMSDWAKNWGYESNTNGMMMKLDSTDGMDHGMMR